MLGVLWLDVSLKVFRWVRVGVIGCGVEGRTESQERKKKCSCLSRDREEDAVS